MPPYKHALSFDIKRTDRSKVAYGHHVSLLNENATFLRESDTSWRRMLFIWFIHKELKKLRLTLALKLQ